MNNICLKKKMQISIIVVDLAFSSLFILVELMKNFPALKDSWNAGYVPHQHHLPHVKIGTCASMIALLLLEN